jgi:catechol 2,3-dioxygenase-like lactoylglutathione lyase family enzyme
MIGAAELVAFVPATDLERAREFYEGVLGLAVESVDSFACVLRSGSVMLRVTKVDGLTPQPFTVLGWSVVDIERAARELSGKGVESIRFDGMGQDDLGIWASPSGAKVLWFKDPDGNTLSVTQHA